MNRAEKWDTGLRWVARAYAPLIIMVMVVLHFANYRLYKKSLLENQSVEWLTVASYVLAFALYVALWANRRRVTGRGQWFYLLLAGFCLFVALEELDWGQRVLLLRPRLFLSLFCTSTIQTSTTRFASIQASA